jgi:hypothetical protein
VTGTVVPRSIDVVVDSVTRAVVDNGGKPLSYFLIDYRKWLTALGQYTTDRESLGLQVKRDEDLRVRNFMVAGVPVVFERPR